mmetsp:Transcript_304/g.808  ORF Transcript_304/g.808 Transcript_304/m.808 type:complete len:84 (+) Transcript_304:2-253(+)
MFSVALHEQLVSADFEEDPATEQSLPASHLKPGDHVKVNSRFLKLQRIESRDVAKARLVKAELSPNLPAAAFSKLEESLFMAV